VYTSATEFQRGFIEALRYAKSKVRKRNSIPEAVSVLDELIGTLEDQEFATMDEALMILE
jgi:hypothetical protein